MPQKSFTGLTGSGLEPVNPALNGISYLTLSTNDKTFGIDNSFFLTYRYDETNNNTTNPESSPSVIVPNDNDTGFGAWILLSAEFSSIKGSALFFDITQNTENGSDTNATRIAGGGAPTTNRGSSITLFGNDHASQGGRVFITAGDVVGGDIFFQTAGSTVMSMDDSGVLRTPLVYFEDVTGLTYREVFVTDNGTLGYDSSNQRRDGNVGIGNSNLEDWHSAWTALQIGGNASLLATTASGSDTSFAVSHNAYYDGDWRYQVTNEAVQYTQANGTHIFRIAASGTADDVISWIEALTIANDGNVGIGTTNPISKLHLAREGSPLLTLERISTTVVAENVIGGINARGGESTIADVGAIHIEADGAWAADDSPTRIVLKTTPAGSITAEKRMAIDKNGNAGFGTTNPIVRIHAASSGTTQLTLERVDPDVGIGNTIGAVNFRGGETTIRNVGVVSCGADGVWDADDSPTKVQISTTPAGSTTAIERMHINKDGNMGVGNSSLEDWVDSLSVIQLGGTAAFTCDTSALAGRNLDIMQNAYYDGGHKRIVEDEASRYLQGNGQHTWYTAVSDAADSTISWVTGMIVYNSGIVAMPQVYDHDMNGETYRQLLINEFGELGYNSSTERKKTKINYEIDTSYIYDLDVAEFEYKKKDENDNYIDEGTGIKEHGLIAEDVEKVSKRLVFYNETEQGLEVEGVHYEKLIPDLLKEIQGLRKEIDILKAK
jgi:hypothetical protein